MHDVTSYWAFWQTHRQKIGLALAGLLIFLAGWQLGRVTSPYYAATPVVFQDRECNQCSSSGGSLTQLEALQDESAGTDTAGTARSAAASGAVAGTSDTASGTTTQSGTFVASINSTLYHHKDCSIASRIKPANQVWFATAAEAEAAGYTPSACTRSKRGN